jgi:hypothetical protein
MSISYYYFSYTLISMRVSGFVYARSIHASRRENIRLDIERIRFTLDIDVFFCDSGVKSFFWLKNDERRVKK